MSDSVDGVIQKLEALGGNILAGIIEGVVEFNQLVQNDAKANVPVRTARLKNSIVTAVAINGGEITGITGTNVKYAKPVEFGTGPRGAESMTDAPPGVTVPHRTTPWVYRDNDGNYRWTRGMPARPYLYPAFKLNKPAAKKIIAARIKKRIEEISK